MKTTNSTINTTWKLCIYACIIGLVLALVGLQRSHQLKAISVTYFPKFPTPTAPSCEQLPTPSQPDFVNASEVTPVLPRAAEAENRGVTKCDIFNGKWVYDPKAYPLYHGSQCPFLGEKVRCQRNGRPDSDYEKWGWEGKECEIPRFNGTDMLERLRGKRVIIVGDSLNRNMWESLACLLYTTVGASRALVHAKNQVYKVFRSKDYSCSVEFYWDPFLVSLDPDGGNGTRVLRLDKLPKFARRWRGADIMVFNSGHWWVHTGKMRAWDYLKFDGKLVETMERDPSFEMGMRTWSQWINHNVDPTKTIVFFRSISPEHKGKDWCEGKNEPIIDESYEQLFPGTMIEIVERTIRSMEVPVRYLNITKISQYRIDAHPMEYREMQRKVSNGKALKIIPDCSHWCLPGVPDTWNRLLYASIIL